MLSYIKINLIMKAIPRPELDNANTNLFDIPNTMIKENKKINSARVPISKQQRKYFTLLILKFIHCV